MPASKSYPRLQVEDGTVQPERAFQYPKAHTIKGFPADGDFTKVSTYRYNKDNVLTAIDGVPVNNDPQPIVGETA